MFHGVEDGVVPALHTTDRGALERARIYQQHNITRHIVTPDGMGGSVTADPVEEDRQCQCGDCGSHRKANRKTGVARPGKNLEVV